MSRARPLVVIDIVGLTPGMLGEATPSINAVIADGFMAPMSGVFPAVTCTAQSSMLTGLMPRDHGAVANGWYFRDQAEIRFWLQPNQLVQGEKVWQQASKDIDGFRCAQMFWWYNMYADVDYSVTPRPIYPADGRKIMGIYSHPTELGPSLESQLGDFPMFNFWGPASDIRSSEWIARASRQVFESHSPDLMFVYLPHLDYGLQRLGPDHPDIRKDIEDIDRVAGELIDAVRARGAEVMIVSEYGIENATQPVHINRVLREHGYVAVRQTLSWELLDAGASRAFAVADHQAAHVYISDPRDVSAVQKLLEATPGVARVYDEEGKRACGLDHPRSGELVVEAEPNAWFTYYYWLDDARAPDFARTVDIHRKPGYDPVELFLDPQLRAPKARIAWRVLQKKLGQRMLMDVIPLDASLVKGCHGRLFSDPDEGPVMIASTPDLACDTCSMLDVKSMIMRCLQRD